MDHWTGFFVEDQALNGPVLHPAAASLFYPDEKAGNFFLRRLSYPAVTSSPIISAFRRIHSCEFNFSHALARRPTSAMSLTSFSSANPQPSVFNVAARIATLRKYLDPQHPAFERIEQHVNIRKVIQLYEAGEFDGNGELWILNGSVVTRKQARAAHTWVWLEVRFIRSSLS